MKKVFVVLGLILMIGTGLYAQSVLREELMAIYPMDKNTFDSIVQRHASNTDGHFIFKLSTFETQLYHRALALIRGQYSVTRNDSYMVVFDASNVFVNYAPPFFT